ncbi:MAG TPA: DUF1634 domain-containing protein [Niabella sp.]|jgi:uncharacterized membrane protein|nr:DUF1634 domain-containing protein [Chitinophagaceae bacterium]HRN48879.1 DUF1634 domain-containing protein [Niabella sp.]HUN03656.1 DUF1634 domain-containing protein [Niabella sp.]
MVEKRLNDSGLSLIISKILRWGVTTAIIMTLFGGVIFLIHHANEKVSFTHFVENDESIKNILKDTWQGLFVFRARSYIMMGILLLFATPLVRVIFSLIGFIIEKDKMYVLITLIVLVIIFISLSGGLH